jgi:hypothetical protein
MMITPVLLFVFNRPHTTSRVLSALRNQTVPPPKLIVYSDGARSADEKDKVDVVRQLIRAIDWTEVELVEREQNFGCAPNIIGGLTEALHSYERAVIIEDDVLPAKHLYQSFCLLLDYYEQEAQVFSVGGYPALLSDALPGYPFDVIMSPRFSSWGWATWAERWHAIESHLHDFRSPFARPEDVPAFAGFDLPGAVTAIEKRPGFYWDYPVALLTLYRGLLHAITRYCLVQNIGVDSGVHFRPNSALLKFFDTHIQFSEKIPIALPPVALQDIVCQAIQEYMYTARHASRSQHPLAHSLRLQVRRIGATIRRIWRQSNRHRICTI